MSGLTRIAGEYSLPFRIEHRKRKHAAGSGCALATALIAIFAGAAFGQTSTSGKPLPGLTVTYASPDGGKVLSTEMETAPNVWLYVPAGKPPSPFLPSGKFTAVWNGFVSAELRGDFLFQAELQGNLKLEINGALVFETAGTGSVSPLSKSVRLNKGANSFKATFTGPSQGDSFVRLSWTEKGPITVPIPSTVFTHLEDAELQKSEKLRLGRDLVLEYRCLKCHVGPGAAAGLPELATDAPSFEAIGARRNYDWMARWILDPKSLRPSAHMPRALGDPKAKDNAEAIAAFLASLKTEGSPAPGKEFSSEQAQLGKRLFEVLNCAGCHEAPDAKQPDPQKISLKALGEKFSAGALEEFLLKPEAHYAWIRMPNFKLSTEEAGQIIAWLNSKGAPPKAALAPTDLEMLEGGKKLIQTTGCLNCHSLKLENQFKAPPLAELSASKWNQGCLAAEPFTNSKAPQFSFSPAEREALQAFAATDRASLTRHVATEFAERQARLLNCRACHGQLEGFPPLEIVGGKLKPEWVKALLAGEVPYKPRPWLEARMPVFAQRAEALAHGLAMQHGFPPQTPPEPPVDLEAGKIGQRLVGVEGGFSCITCHAVGPLKATAVFEAEGINLTRASSRLLRPYFQRWLRNPPSIEPQTKMPIYFDAGKSPLTEVYGGDAEKQIGAIWEYFRLGEKMPPPKGAE